MNKSGLLSIVSIFVGVPAHAATIEAVIKTTSVIRDDIGRATFGAGIEFQSPQFRWLMDTGPDADGPATPAQRKVKGFNLGSLRFPSGDGAQLYLWDDPQHSITATAVGKDARSKWITQEQILKFTSPQSAFADGLDAQRVFQVNSCQYVDYEAGWKVRQVNRNFFQKELPAEVDEAVLEKVASRAAAWVQDNNGKPAHESVEFWEVGNEDWIYWSGAQYGTIFNKFREKMLPKRAGIKFLAQGLSADFATHSNGTNTMENWVEGMKANITGLPGSVYAYSDHQYMTADEYASDAPEQKRIKQTQDILAKVATNERLGNLKAKLASSPLTSPWKIWITEFNTFMRAKGKLDNPQDMGQALVIADWTGKMLVQGVERMFYHSLDHHPDFALVQYVNEGGTITAPRVTPPGYAYTIFPQEFGKTMVNNTVGTSTYPNVRLTAPNGMGYEQLAVYSSIRKDSVNGDTLRVIVINRATTGVTTFNLKTENIAGARRMKNAPAKYTYRQLRSANLSDSNRAATDAVSWSAPTQYDSSEWGITGASLGPASVNLFVIPLQ